MDTPFRLGRRVEHDPRSRAFPAPMAEQVRTVTHRHYGPVLDQGDVGSCSGNAISQALNTAGLHTSGQPLLTETDAVALYSLATTLDDAPGSYPPDDTGSSGLAVCKAAQAKGLIASYRHAFGLDQALAALTLSPVIIGIDWTEDMFRPDPAGFVHPTGAVAGGHEVALVALNVAKRYVTAVNSWGPRWGSHGRFRLSFDDLGALLARDGDVTVPIR